MQITSSLMNDGNDGAKSDSALSLCYSDYINITFEDKAIRARGEVPEKVCLEH